MGDLGITPEGRLGAGDPRVRLHRAAAQFEAVFVNQLLASAQAAKLDDEPLLGDGPGADTWRQLLHGAFAERAAGRFGLGEAVERTLALRAGFAGGKP
jgi:Rod binding domain-containing protein